MAKRLYEDAEQIEDENQEWLLCREASERLDAAFALMEAAEAKSFDRPTDIVVLRRSFASRERPISAITSRPLPPCRATRHTASPAGTSNPPLPCCWRQLMP